MFFRRATPTWHRRIHTNVKEASKAHRGPRSPRGGQIALTVTRRSGARFRPANHLGTKFIIPFPVPVRVHRVDWPERDVSFLSPPKWNMFRQIPSHFRTLEEIGWVRISLRSGPQARFAVRPQSHHKSCSPDHETASYPVS